MRLVIAMSIAIMLCGSSIAKHDEDEKDHDDNHGKGKRTVTIIEQAPVQKNVIVVQQPMHRHVTVVRPQPRERFTVRVMPPPPPKVSVTVRFRDDDARVVHAYYQEDYPKHHKKHMLPPGWRKKVIIGRPVPRNIIVYEVPEELEIRLPPLPPRYVRFMIGNSIFIKDVKTNFVIDACFDEND